MDFTDYVADLEGEVRALRDRITELEEQLRVACERKVEEVSVYFDYGLACARGGSRGSKTDEGVLPEEIDDLNHLKKEETIGLDTGAVKHQVGQKRSVSCSILVNKKQSINAFGRSSSVTQSRLFSLAESQQCSLYKDPAQHSRKKMAM